MCTCSTLLLFPYPVPADIHGSVQHFALNHVPVDVLSRLFLWFRQVKSFECHTIHPPQEVQCVHTYSVAWGSSHMYHSLFDRNWRWAGRGGRAVWREMSGGAVRGEL